MPTAFAEPAVAARFAGYPPEAKGTLLALRELIFATAEATPGVGPLTETLKWGEPAYLTAESKSGTTLRIDWKERSPEVCGVYFHCQTDLAARFRSMFPTLFVFEGNRALLLSLDAELPREALAACFEAALTYHARRRPDRR